MPYRVEITREPADVHNDNKPYLLVTPVAIIGGKEHETRLAWSVPSMAIAQRLKRAIEEGAVFTEPVLLTDVYGKKYASTHSIPGHWIRGRALNADLRAIGY